MHRSSGPCDWQTSWVERIKQADTFEELERLEQTFMEELSAKASPQWSRCSSSTGSAAQEHVKYNPGRIRYLYYVNKPRALREIWGESSSRCEIPLDQLYRYFKHMFEGKEGSSAAPRPGDLTLLPRIESGFEELCGEFTPEEVTERLHRVRNRGRREKIPPQLLRQRDPGCHILAALFNGCRWFGRIPSDWKKSRTILICKNKSGDLADPSNWRPLNLFHPLYKMYARCLAHRINAWAMKGGAISSQQEAFVSSSEGTQKHIFLLQSLLDKVWRVGCEHECAVAKLDFANAFGSLPHSHIFSTLSEFGMPQAFLALLRELYSGCTTVVHAAKGETPDIAFRNGVSQGCPLSPVIFNLAIEPLIRYIASGSEGFWLYGKKLDVLAYADDLVLIAENEAMLQRMLDRASAAANWIGWRFKTDKCTTFHIHNKLLLPSEFALQGASLPFLRNRKPFIHLGIPIYFPDQTPQTVKSLKASFWQMMEGAEKVDQSSLHPNQKMNFLRTHLSQISSFLKNVPVSKKDLKEANWILQEMMGKWLNASEMEMSTYCVHQNYKILEMQDLADVAVVAYAFHLLTCKDEIVATVAFNMLCSNAQKGQGKRNLSGEDLAAYLNGSVGYDSGNFTSLWSRARNATLRLRKFIHCCWSCNNRHEFVIKVARQNEEVVFPLEGRSLEANLKDAVREAMVMC